MLGCIFYLRVYFRLSFAFSKIKLLFVTPSFRKQLIFPKLNCFLLKLHTLELSLKQINKILGQID